MLLPTPYLHFIYVSRLFRKLGESFGLRPKVRNPHKLPPICEIVLLYVSFQNESKESLMCFKAISRVGLPIFVFSVHSLHRCIECRVSIIHDFVHIYRDYPSSEYSQSASVYVI
jgi:hypothetical protein